MEGKHEKLHDQGRVQLSAHIWVFFGQKLSKHFGVFEGERIQGDFGPQPIAIKLVEKNEQSRREVGILKKLGLHENVVSLFEAGLYQDTVLSYIYIALERCHDQNLREFVEIRNANGIPFETRLVIRILKQVVSGVEYIHGKNIAHKDLKPDNILFSLDQKTAKIADFGLSEVITEKKIKVKKQFGTIGFRPPESFGNGYASLKSDIFPLGAIFYFMMANGKNPFGEEPDIQNVNSKGGKSDLSCLLVPNPETTKHLIKCMIELKQTKRPNISQVSKHPFWEGKEVPCNFDYTSPESPVIESSDEEEQASDVGDLSTLKLLQDKYAELVQRSSPVKLRAAHSIKYKVSSNGTDVQLSFVDFSRDVTYIISLRQDDQMEKSFQTQNRTIKLCDLKPHTEYQCAVRAVNAGHESEDFNFIVTTEPGDERIHSLDTDGHMRTEHKGRKLSLAEYLEMRKKST